MIWYIVSSIAMGLSALLLYIYYLWNGQFDKLEEVKYQLVRDEEDAEI